MLGVGCAGAEETDATSGALVGHDPSPIDLAQRFEVRAEGCEVDLGSWAKVDGLGGSPRPPREPLKLRRAANGGTQKVKAWLNELATSPPHASALTVSLVGAAGGVVATWHVQGVVPEAWALDMASPAQVVVETLTLSHGGVSNGQPCASGDGAP